MRYRARALMAALAVVVAACSTTDDATIATTTTTSPPTTTRAQTTTPEPVSSTTAEPADRSVAVFWAWTIPTISAGSPERLGAGRRAADTPMDAIHALFDGPNELETELGMTTSVPDGTVLLGLDIDDGEAVVDLSPEAEASGGTLGETMRLAQLVFTLTQFETVERVFLRIDGEDRTEFGSHGIDVSAGVTRDHFVDVRALITVTEPGPGAVVDDPFTLSGESNTFEAGIQWVLVDAEGLIIAEGFGTASAGNGTWGRFEFEVDVPDDATGTGAIIVFETSARDGTQQNVVEYPIVFGSP